MGRDGRARPYWVTIEMFGPDITSGFVPKRETHIFSCDSSIPHLIQTDGFWSHLFIIFFCPIRNVANS